MKETKGIGQVGRASGAVLGARNLAAGEGDSGTAHLIPLESRGTEARGRNEVRTLRGIETIESITAGENGKIYKSQRGQDPSGD